MVNTYLYRQHQTDRDNRKQDNTQCSLFSYCPGWFLTVCINECLSLTYFSVPVSHFVSYSHAVVVAFTLAFISAELRLQGPLKCSRVGLR